MKPHFGQSDAAMNKLAGCNSFPNASKGLEMIAELENKAREAGYDTPLEYLRATHEEAAGMGLEPIFFERLKMQPAVNMTDSMTPIDEDFDPVKERDAAYDLGCRDAQRQHMTPSPLPEGYYGHHSGCDCAVCEQMAWDESQRKIVDGEWNKLLDDNAMLWRCFINYRDALERIANTPDDYEMEYCREIAVITLAEGHKPR